jgi:hypothetical protein
VTKIRLLALTAALTMLSGCAVTGSEPGSTESALPTLSPAAAPPSEPTDDIKPTEVVVGTVNRGGTGPCYGLITDDGVQYALYEAKGRALKTGIRVTVDASPSRLRIDCGTGTLVEVKTLTPVR